MIFVNVWIMPVQKLADNLCILFGRRMPWVLDALTRAIWAILFGVIVISPWIDVGNLARSNAITLPSDSFLFASCLCLTALLLLHRFAVLRRDHLIGKRRGSAPAKAQLPFEKIED